MRMTRKASAEFRSDTRGRVVPIERAPTFHPLGTDKYQLSESVAMHLRERIISGQLHAGQFLRIDAIAKELGVSSTPVREGLLLLHSESFVRLMPRRGFVVNSFSAADLQDLFWVQAIIAAELAGRAVARLSRADLVRLEELHATHARAVADGDQAVAAQAGHQFHRTINLAAQSPRLAIFLGSLTKQLPNRFYASVEGALQNSVKDHQTILAALRAKDEAAVSATMQRHILTGSDYLIAALKRQGVLDAVARGRDSGRKPRRTKPLRATKGKRAVR